MAWISLQSVAPVVANAYGISNTEETTISLVYMAMFIVANFPSNYALDVWGLRLGVIVGVTLTAIGLCIKALINKSFVWVIVGQVLSAIGQPFIINAAPKLAAQWYGQDERVIAVTIATACEPLGVAVGFVFPSFFVLNSDANEENV
eukprot:CAMPEP_0116874132 /NCGR_PEP_ID=MMETSP0463-20121206/5561_1 /TAXON_ID=181622 /ORGANISM="Strombidinopsis sp, Strain SopsisLIS2011" /LENGTH=146 /DNA_ID=CAMNT_0004517405 /DNA_START=191 /DNA_END=631 /DNA_ORIENTATION=+